MAATDFRIEERTGPKRQIHLRGRSLPYEGVAFGGSQRVDINYFPGNPVAIAQVIGPTLKPTTLTGKWKDIFLFDEKHAALLVGFPALHPQTPVPLTGGQKNAFRSGGAVSQQTARTAQILSDAMDKIRKSGQLLRVEWGPQVRFGYLHEYTQTYDRIEDIGWEMMFKWIGETDAQPRIELKNTDTTGLLKKLLQTLDQVLNALASGFLRADAFVRRFTQLIIKFGSFFEELLGSLERMANFALLPQQMIGTLKATFTGILLAANDALATFASISAAVTSSGEGAAPEDVASNAAAQQAFRQLMLRLAAEGRLSIIELDKLTVPEIKAVVIVKQGQTLRSISDDQYGTQNNWRALQDYNGFASSIVPIGTFVRVPVI